MMQQIETHKKTIVALLAIVAIGFFLRTYHYEDTLRFGKDQARDAGIVRDIIQGNEPLPLLGPKAGGTDYKMGPIFYYFQIASAKIFGVEPDKMAYPDLIFSILAVPVLYLFLRKYFNANLSLVLTGLFAVSFFAVQNGRFAWNPNSLPLFSILFLYAFLKMADTDSQKTIIWAAVAGLALGVGVQLHTLFILVMGIVFFLFSAYLIRKKVLNFKNVLITIAVALILNLPQIFSEIKTGGENTKAFVYGMAQKSENKDLFPRNLIMAATWTIQTNTMFIYPAGDDSKNQFYTLAKNTLKNKKGIGNALLAKYPDMLARLALGTTISIFGYFLLGYFIKKETDDKKKDFLRLISLYLAVSFLMMIPLSHILMLRYFLILQFVPLILLGLVANFFQLKFGRRAFLTSLGILFLLGIYNFYVVLKEINAFATGKGDVQIAIWKEEKFAGEFILSHSNPTQNVVFVYEPQNGNKFIRSLSYFNPSIEAPDNPNNGTPSENPDTAYFSLVLNEKKEINMWKHKIEKSNYEVSDSGILGRIAIFKLDLKEKVNIEEN